jgi:nucleoside-diphosphate-sugar epimerase
MELPRIVISGASGFVGRHLLDALKGRYKIFAMARRSQRQCGAPVHPNILWHRVDIGDMDALSTIFRRIKDGGGAELFLHLAAYYDFTGEEHPEYWRTNVTGLRNVLELCKPLRLKKFIFASSTAASKFPLPGKALNESSPPDGDHVYARTKGIGEEMLKEYADTVPSCIVRFAAMFSDWCEYPPLFMFLGSWLEETWTSRVLAGKGISAIPYLHIRDAITMLRKLIDQINTIEQGEVLIASNDGAVNHLQLFEAATLAFFGQRKKPVLMPKVLCRPGIHLRRFFGNFSGHRPFESPWMCRYIDLQMNVDSNKTRQRLNWKPRPRLEMVRRIPFMVENFRAEPAEWYHRNTAALKELPLVTHLKIYQLMKAHEREIETAFNNRIFGPEGEERFATYRSLTTEEQLWSNRQLLLQLMNSIRTRDKALFKNYCQDLAEHRFEQGFTVQEVCDAVTVMNNVCIKILGEDSTTKELHKTALKDYITMTVQFGIDEVQEVFEQWGEGEYQPDMLALES